MLYALTTDYILVTGNNWKGPIGHFHLTLDKEKPDNVMSLCWDGELKKTGATTFEATRENFAPAHDIHLAGSGAAAARSVTGQAAACRTSRATRASSSFRPLGT